MSRCEAFAAIPACSEKPELAATSRRGASGSAAALDGEIKESDGDLERAIDAYRAAAALEDALPYAEPPTWPFPMRRFLGAALLAAEHADEAEEIYRADLVWNQNNGWSLYGLWQSLMLQGKTAEAEAVRALFDTAWRHADVTLEASRF